MLLGFFMIGFTGLMLVIPDRKDWDSVCVCSVKRCCLIEEGKVAKAG